MRNVSLMILPVWCEAGTQKNLKPHCKIFQNCFHLTQPPEIKRDFRVIKFRLADAVKFVKNNPTFCIGFS